MSKVVINCRENITTLNESIRLGTTGCSPAPLFFFFLDSILTR